MSLPEFNIPDEPPCDRCGAYHERCKAHNRQDKPCRYAPEPNQRVCRFHGGRSPQALRKAREAETLLSVAQLLTSHGVEYEKEHPLDGLLEEIWRSAAAAKVYGQLVSMLDVPQQPEDQWAEISVDDDGQRTFVRRHDMLYGPDHKGDGAPHVLVKLWNDERERHAKFCKMALEAGIAERMVRMAEEQGSRIVQVIVSVVDDPDLNLSDEQKQAARTVAARHLRAIPGGEAA